MTPDLAPPPTNAAARTAYDTLRGAILYGALMPGDRLVAADLRARYGLGLTPIREALTRLAGEGLAEGAAHQGLRVRGLDRAELADLMDTRARIERMAITGAIAAGDAEWEAEIVAAAHLLALTPLPEPGDDGTASRLWEERHRAFHFALVRACPSPWLLRLWNMLADHSERYRKLRLLHHAEPLAEVRDVVGEHAEIVEAVLAREAERAADLLDDHLAATRRSADRLLARLENGGTAGG
ncbi:MAG: FCD domain-containing protein [Rhodobacteraceae bacterium]|nr:FCD domain-containing protein [Paracoccaceae bacterium]